MMMLACYESRDLESHSEADWYGGARLVKRTYTLAIAGEPGGYSAHVPGLPATLVTGVSLDELTERAVDAIRLYWETDYTELPTGISVNS